MSGEHPTALSRGQQRLLLGMVCLAGVILLKPDWLTMPVARSMKEILPGGVRVTYYQGADFEKPLCRRSERRLMCDYGSSRPAWGAPRNHWSARWEGVLLAPADAEYEFYLQSDDGARFWIDDHLVVDHWGDHGWVPGMHGKASLKAGRHRLRIDHYDRQGAAAIRLRWSGGGIPANTTLGVPHVRKR